VKERIITNYFTHLKTVRISVYSTLEAIRGP